jgi:hypothetical protein
LKLYEWYTLRGAGYIQRRTAALLGRYGITPSKAIDRVTEGVDWLAELGCSPTFPVPARVIQRNPRFFQQLQEAGVELAVHGYDHVALAEYPPAEASNQLAKAAGVFARHGIDYHGFRCPYLSCTSDLIKALPEGLFDYSSNRAIEWDVVPAAEEPVAQPAIAEVLQRVYKPAPASQVVSVPAITSNINILEIPVNLPDDLELHDARCLDAEAMGEAWSQVLIRTHQRGELFVLMYHPELMDQCCQPLSAVLNLASSLSPSVWIARLCDISSWWREKAQFSVTLQSAKCELHLSFDCSERGTILIRDIAADCQQQWDSRYHRLFTPYLDVPVEPRPLLGVYPEAPARTVSFLQEQGYLLDSGQSANQCAIYLDARTLHRLDNQVELVRHIEESRGPLVRYGRWPDGAKSALSITGDLDALTLVDYASRLFIR